MFTTFFILMSVFPYSGYMALQLVPSSTNETAGMYAGFLSSSYMVGRACSSVFWGQMADIYGRKFVLVVALVTSVVGSVIFGFSTSYAMALTVRVTMGLANGSFIVTRTASSELAKGDKKLEAKGVGVLMSMVGYGMLIAPAIGGFLSEPLQQHPNNKWFQRHEHVLESFPFLLPNLVAASLAFVSLAVVWLCVEETLPQHQRRSIWMIGNDCRFWMFKWCCMTRRQRRENSSILKPTSSIYVEERQNKKCTKDLENDLSVQGLSSEFFDAKEEWDEEFESNWEKAEDILESIECVVAATMCASRDVRLSFVKALNKDPPAPIRENDERPPFSSGDSLPNEKTPLFSKQCTDEEGTKNHLATITQAPSHPQGRQVIQLSSTFSDDSIRTKAGPTMGEIMENPRTKAFLMSYWLYSFASVAQSEAFPLFAMAHLGQGLGMGESSIGMVGTVAGLIYCVGQYFTFSMMMNRFGLVRSLRYGALFANLPVIFIPCSLYMSSRWMQIGLLSLLSGVSMISGSVYLGCNTIGANRTVDATTRATMNGLSSLGASIGRGAGPIVAGFLVAGFMASGFIPSQLSAWFLYVILLFVGLLAYVSTLSIPESEDDD
jgi:MFS family permease